MNIFRIVIAIIILIIALSAVRYVWSTQDDVARNVYRKLDDLAFKKQGLTEDEVFNFVRSAIEYQGLDPNYVDLGTGLSLLMYAARTGSYEIVKYLVDKGADVHFTNPLLETPLMYAALSGDMRVLQVFGRRARC